MAKIERIDKDKSFITIFKVYDTDGKMAEEVPVWIWEADAVETKIQNLTWKTIKEYWDKTGESIVKGTA